MNNRSIFEAANIISREVKEDRCISRQCKRIWKQVDRCCRLQGEKRITCNPRNWLRIEKLRIRLEERWKKLRGEGT